MRQGAKITVGRMMSGKTTRFARALHLAATALRNNKSALGAFIGRMGSRIDKTMAVAATAHKLARPI